jgi:hypothetical protein
MIIGLGQEVFGRNAGCCEERRRHQPLKILSFLFPYAYREENLVK